MHRWNQPVNKTTQPLLEVLHCWSYNYWRTARPLDFATAKLPIWMTDCLLLFYRTINTFFVVFCLNTILIRSVLGLGAMNLCCQPSETLETFLKENCLKICIDIIVQLRYVNCFPKIKVEWSEVLVLLYIHVQPVRLMLMTFSQKASYVLTYYTCLISYLAENRPMRLISGTAVVRLGSYHAEGMYSTTYNCTLRKVCRPHRRPTRQRPSVTTYTG